MITRLFCLVLFLSVTPAAVASDGAYGTPNAEVPELAQFEFFLGDWRVDMTYMGEDGGWHAVAEPAHVKTFFHADGRTLQTIFTTPKGFFSTDVRSYDTKAGLWRAQFLNAKAQRWHSFTSQWTDGKMATIVPGGYGGDGPDIKTEMTDITSDGFTNNVYRKMQDGSWLHTYKMYYVRQVE